MRAEVNWFQFNSQFLLNIIIYNQYSAKIDWETLQIVYAVSFVHESNASEELGNIFPRHRVIASGTWSNNWVTKSKTRISKKSWINISSVLHTDI